ncbi:ATP-dependent RNA helicase [Wickerhamomyces ciferrii]|uniref:ATP-dependent RNA helicase n=1 Tax=Wickerhamomyces ciferrii (strain ATCC 14091 / BCRC 22168 / CBS 111 / JCM 3599 / NBRC 0793 / NRRL Y-1031 F-60-10) TaxID=1206466 RepID=K0KIN5_WICCF|nr:ATP-dependent RNA helicase [Wickerhamomyces ciferrii]CCH42846.1 ATP-dependent RNA helicase [Wickerhamomyces ciferrii]
MVSRKYLCDAKVTTVKLKDADLAEVQTTISGGDYALPSLAREVNKIENNKLVVDTYLNLVETRGIKSTLVFAVDIKHVEDLAKLFHDRGVKVDYVTARTSRHYREPAVQRFKNGETNLLINCGVFTEGTDIPNIDSILMVRPTKSKNLLAQMIGRGLRKHDGKDVCHIIDFVGINNSDVISLPSLHNLKYNSEIIDHFADKKKKTPSSKNPEISFNTVKEPNHKTLHYVPEAFDQNILEFSTYKSLNDFRNKGADTWTNDLFLVKNSLYPWLKIDEDTWIISNPDSSSTPINSHIKLQRHREGIKRGFLKHVSIDKVYTSKKAFERNFDKKSLVYSLSLHTLKNAEHPKFKFDFQGSKDSKQRRFRSNLDDYENSLLMPLSRDIVIPLSYVDKFVKGVSSDDFTKNSKWRSLPASESSKTFLLHLVIESQIAKTSPAKLIPMMGMVQSLTEGEAQELILSYTASGGVLFEKLIKKSII